VEGIVKATGALDTAAGIENLSLGKNSSRLFNCSNNVLPMSLRILSVSMGQPEFFSFLLKNILVLL